MKMEMLFSEKSQENIKKWFSKIINITGIIGIIIGLFVGAYFSDNFAVIFPSFDKDRPYISNVEPAENLILRNASSIKIYPEDVGGSGLNLQNSKISLYGSKKGHILGDISHSSDQYIEFMPNSDLLPDTYTVKTIIKDRAGNIVEKTYSFTIIEANISVKTMFDPILKDGNYYARFLLINTGDIPLSDIYVDYFFLCFMNESKRANLTNNYLGPGDSTYFDVPFSEEMDYNCKPIAKFNMDLYQDGCGNKFVACKDEKQEACSWCRVNINVTADELSSIKSFKVYYPFFKGNLTFGIFEGCLSQEQLDTMNLTKTPIDVFMIQLKDICIKGEMPLEWCKENNLL